MIVELEYFVATYIADELKKDVIESFDILDDLDFEYNEKILNIVMSEGDVENAQLVDNFLKTIESFIVGLLHEHGIVLSEDTSLEFKNKILHAVISIADYENKDDLSPILDSNEEPNYKFAEVIDHVTELDLMNVFSKIESVNPDFFKKLAEIINRSLIKIDENELEKQDIVNQIVVKLKNIKAFTKYDKALGFTLVNANMVLGSDFTKYSCYADKHFEYLSPEDIAKEVFILLTMSGEGFLNPLVTFRKYSDTLFSDLDVITKVDTKLNSLVMEFDKFIIENQENKLC